MCIVCGTVIRDCYGSITAGQLPAGTTHRCVHVILNYTYNEPLGLTLEIDATICRCHTSLCNDGNVTSEAPVIPRRHMTTTSYTTFRPLSTSTARWITSPRRSSGWQAPTSGPNIIGLPNPPNRPDSSRTTPSIYITNTQSSSNNSNREFQSTSQRTHQSVETSSAKTHRSLRGLVVFIVLALVYMHAR